MYGKYLYTPNNKRFLYKNIFNVTFPLYNILKLRGHFFGLLDKDLCDSTDLKTEQLFVLYLLMTWIVISWILGNSKIHSVTSTRGYSFVTPPHCLEKWTIDQLFKNNRVCKHMKNFKNPPPTFCVIVINVCCLTQITLFLIVLWQVTFTCTSSN